MFKEDTHFELCDRPVETHRDFTTVHEVFPVSGNRDICNIESLAGSSDASHPILDLSIFFILFFSVVKKHCMADR